MAESGKEKKESGLSGSRGNADSLDFTDLGVARPAKTARARPRPKRAAGPHKHAPPVAAKPRKGVRVVLAAVALGGAVVALTHVPHDAPAPPAAKGATPLRVPQAVATEPAPSKSARPYAAGSAAVPPLNATPATPAPQHVPAVPTAFLEPFQAYAAEPEPKAIALALDRDGRFAYASVSAHSTQDKAGAEALSDCESHRANGGIKQSCRLFAIGAKIVW